MELIIKLTNHYMDITELRVHQGKIFIHKNIREKMPEGVFQNGIVIDTNVTARTLREMLKEHQIHTKKARLCISSMDIIHKEIKIPQGPQKQVRGLLEHELNRTESLKNGFVFDYIQAKANAGIGDRGEDSGYQNYQVYLLPEELIANYQTTIKHAGLNLTGIIPGACSMERLAALLNLHGQKELTILAGVEEQGVNLLMTGAGIKTVYQNMEVKDENNMEENMFIVSAVRQIQSSISPKERVLAAMEESILKLVQFQSQSSAGASVGSILIYGSLAADPEFAQQLADRIGIPTKRCVLPKEQIVLSAENKEGFFGHYAIGVCCGKMLGERKELSFLNLESSRNYMTLKEQIPLLAGLGCIFFLALFYAVTMFGNLRMEKKIAKLEQDIRQIEAESEYQRKLKVRSQLLNLEEYNENCELCIGLMEQNERLKPELFSAIDALVPQNISIEAYGYENRMITIKCSSSYQDGPADFARVLTDSKLFEQVKYAGFSAYQDVEGSTYYSFSLECSR